MDCKIGYVPICPGTVEFYANNTLKWTVSGTSTGAKAVLDMGKDFPGAFGASANKVRVRARNGEGGVSEWFEKPVVVLPLPKAVAKLGGFSVQTTANQVYVAYDFDAPQPPLKQIYELPLLGRFGFEVTANASFDYTLTDGDWEAVLGAGAEERQGKRATRPIPAPIRKPKLKLYLGQKEIPGYVWASSRGTATLGSGIRFSDIQGSGGITAPKFVVWKLSPLDLLGPGLTTVVSKIPGLGPQVNKISIPITAQPSASGDIRFSLDPTFAFAHLQISGDVAIEATIEPDLVVCKGRFYVGGKPGFTLQRPGTLIKQLRFQAYAGGEFSAWVFTYEVGPHVFISVAYPKGSGALSDYGILAVPLRDRSDGRLRPMDRSYLDDGLGRFVGIASPTTRRRGLDLYAGGQVQIDPVLLDEPLIENVFPYSEPALATDGHRLMLLYVSDNGAVGDLQFTDINWMWFDGTTWTEPAAIKEDSHAEFAPQVAFDGNGDAVALWQRVKAPDFDTLDIAAMASQMEIVSSRWDAPSGQWSEPIALTDNDRLDHGVLLCGPMADGSLIAVWTQNPGNQLMGDETSPDAVLWSQWRPSLQSWSPPQTLLDDVPYRLSQSLSGAGGTAAYAWTCDMDGDPSTVEDQELFICSWDGNTWTAPYRVTEDTTPDRNVSIAVADTDEVYLVWQRGEDLVMDRNLTGPSLVREDSNSVGFVDYAMTLGPNGNLVLLWQGQSEAGPNPFYMVYDPVAGRWSQDSQIFVDSALERSFSPVWDAEGNLTVAYNRVQISKSSRSVATEDGEIVEVDNIPTPGRVDLGVFKRRLVTDLGFNPGDFTADGNDFLPGDEVLLKSTVRNLGDLGIDNVTVAFYDGDPISGGSEIGRRTIGGYIAGGATASVEMTWHVPEPARAYSLLVVTDPDGLIEEMDEGNNRLSLSIGGTDLSLTLLSSMVASDGSARAVVEVANNGAPAAPATLLAVRRADRGDAAILVTATVPELTPRQVAQIALDLPAGTLSPGDTCFVITADDANDVDDVDRENNQITFYLSLPEPLLLPEPVARWSFDEGEGATAADSAGKHDAAVVGATWVDGILGGALRFDGDDYVDCGSSPGLAPEKLTVSLWMRPEAFDGDMYLVGKVDTGLTNCDYTIATKADATVEFYFGETTLRRVSLRSQRAIRPGEWIHVIATRDGSRASLYLDGRLDASVSYWLTSSDKVMGLKIGAYGSGPSGFFKGVIDDVRIYNAALAAEEVQALYDENPQ